MLKIVDGAVCGGHVKLPCVSSRAGGGEQPAVDCAAWRNACENAQDVNLIKNFTVYNWVCEASKMRVGIL